MLRYYSPNFSLRFLFEKKKTQFNPWNIQNIFFAPAADDAEAQIVGEDALKPHYIERWAN